MNCQEALDIIGKTQETRVIDFAFGWLYVRSPMESPSFLKDQHVLIMGLLDTSSIAWAIGQRVVQMGGKVTYTVQNERFRDVLLRRSFKKQGLSVDDYAIIPCDVTQAAEVEALFQKISAPLQGVVHSIAYANPATCLTNSMFEAPAQDLRQAFEISAASFALVLKEARAKMAAEGSAIALSFNTQTAFPGYDWMGVCKAALEAVMRYTARDMGRQGVRVNVISAGPLHTKAATSIPGFTSIRETWSTHAPLNWDPEKDHEAVADSALFLLSPLSRKITGQVLYVDGGFHANRSTIKT